MAGNFSQIFLCDAFLNVMQAAKENVDFIIAVAKKFFEVHDHNKVLFSLMENMVELKPILDAWGDVACLFRAVIHLLDQQCPGGECTAEDVFAICDYKGKSIFHRSMKAVLQEPFWDEHVKEVLRTSGSKALLTPKVEKLNEILPTVSLASPAEHFTTVASLLKEVKDGLRALERSNLTQRIAEAAMSVAKGMMEVPAGSTADVHHSASKVDAVVALLMAVGNIPGVPTLCSDLKQWAHSTKASRGVSDFVAACASATASNVDYESVKKHLPAAPWHVGGSGAAEILSATANFVEKSLLYITNKAGP